MSRTPGFPQSLGLARLMRVAFEGGDLTPIWEHLLVRAQADPADAGALMDLSTILLLSGQRDQGLAVQGQAVAISPLFQIVHGDGRGLRILAFVARGDFMANTPLDFLIETADATLTLLFVDETGDIPESVPDHDVAFLAVGESSDNAPILRALRKVVDRWPRPVVNAAPERIAGLTRDGVSSLFADDPLILAPATLRVTRETLGAVVRGELAMAAAAPGVGFPIVARPLDTHAGAGMARIEDVEALAAYLAAHDDAVTYVCPFIDYASADGLFRKQRIAFIHGRPFAGHMAISDHWMVHYLNAGMAENAGKRFEEARFMADFENGFARRHGAAFARLHAAIGLDYFAIDCAEMPDGRLLLFEADVAMILHDLDPAELYPYKKPAMRKLMDGFLAALQGSSNAEPAEAARAAA